MAWSLCSRSPLRSTSSLPHRLPLPPSSSSPPSSLPSSPSFPSMRPIARRNASVSAYAMSHGATVSFPANTSIPRSRTVKFEWSPRRRSSATPLRSRGSSCRSPAAWCAGQYLVSVWGGGSETGFWDESRGETRGTRTVLYRDRVHTHSYARTRRTHGPAAASVSPSYEHRFSCDTWTATISRSARLSADSRPFIAWKYRSAWARRLSGLRLCARITLSSVPSGFCTRRYCFASGVPCTASSSATVATYNPSGPPGVVAAKVVDDSSRRKAAGVRAVVNGRSRCMATGVVRRRQPEIHTRLKFVDTRVI